MIPIESLRKAMREIAAKKGGFTLFGLFMRSDAPGVWDLVVAAPWLEAGRLKATSELVTLLTDAIGEQALRHLSRIQTVGSDSPALKAILKAFSVEDGELHVQNSNLFGLEIADAIILRSKKPKSHSHDLTPAVGSGGRSRR
jgi:hypothetical protein